MKTVSLQQPFVPNPELERAIDNLVTDCWDTPLRGSSLSEVQLGELAGKLQVLRRDLSELLYAAGKDRPGAEEFCADVGTVSIDWENPRALVRFASEMLDLASIELHRIDWAWAGLGFADPDVELACESRAKELMRYLDMRNRAYVSVEAKQTENE